MACHRHLVSESLSLGRLAPTSSITPVYRVTFPLNQYTCGMKNYAVIKLRGSEAPILSVPLVFRQLIKTVLRLL